MQALALFWKFLEATLPPLNYIYIVVPYPPIDMHRVSQGGMPHPVELMPLYLRNHSDSHP